MSRYVLVHLFAILLLSCAVQAQTPRTAVRLYKEGNKKLEQGNYDGAIEDLTRAIAISSQLQPNSSGHPLLNGNGFAETAPEASDVTVSDPLTAQAYTSRGFARFQKRDFADRRNG